MRKPQRGLSAAARPGVSPGRLVLGVLLLGSILSAGCEPYSRPNAPLPELEASGLDGKAWNREALAGKPWVIGLWVPR